MPSAPRPDTRSAECDGLPTRQGLVLAEMGQRVRDARTRRGLSRSEASRLAEVEPAYWYRLEHGLAAGPTLEAVARIAVTLGVSIDWLAFGDAAPGE